MRNGELRHVPGGSMLSPVQLTSPFAVSAQWLNPSVNVGVFVLFRQNASPAVVVCSVSPVPAGSGYSHEVGSPIVGPSIALRSANPNENVGACPAAHVPPG